MTSEGKTPIGPCPYCNVPCAYCRANAVGPFPPIPAGSVPSAAETPGAKR